MSEPSSMNMNLPQALTSDMLLGLKPSAPKSRSYRLSVAPMNKSVFSGGDQVIIELPTGRKGTWLDQSQSYLKFSVQCKAAADTPANYASAGIFVENTAYNFIQRLDIYNSSNLLETMNEYGQLCNHVIDCSLTQSDKASMSTLIGSNPSNVNIVIGANYTAGPTAELIRGGDRSGLALAAVKDTFATAIPYTFCLPLLSGVVGINASKMLPIGKLNAPIRMEFYLAANDDAIYYGTAGAGATWQIINVEFCACFVELQDDAYEQQYPQGQPVFISTTSYRHASTYLPQATAGEFTTLVPFRCASLTALYARFRNHATAAQGVNASAAYRKSSSINPNLSNFYFRIGSSIYPNKPVYLINGTQQSGGAEAFAELLKSFHALSSSVGNSVITYPQYNVAQAASGAWSEAVAPGSRAVARNTSDNAFCIGLECQSFSNRNDTILSGISTLNSQIFFTGVVASGSTVGVNYTVDFFSSLDAILVIVDGVMSTKF